MIKHNKNIWNKKYKGATSLFVVLILGMLLTILVAGMATLALREQQQSVNTDFSARALQVAESAVKLAVQKLNDDPNYTKKGCPPDSVYSVLNTGNQSISCVEVSSDYSNGTYEGYSDQDRGSLLFMGPDFSGSSLRYINLKWNDKELDKQDLPYAYVNALYPKLKASKLDDKDFFYSAAAIELTVFWWPKSSIVTTAAPLQGKINSASVFVMPGQNDTGTTANSTQILQSRCTPQNDAPADLENYTCGTISTPTKKGYDIITGLGIPTTYVSGNNYNFAVMIKPRYAGTHFSAVFYNNGNVAIANIKSSTATIDVTARYGNLYRRIKAQKVVMPQAMSDVFDAVLYSGRGDNNSSTNDICKQLVVFASDYKKAPSNNSRCNN